MVDLVQLFEKHPAASIALRCAKSGEAEFPAGYGFGAADKWDAINALRQAGLVERKSWNLTDTGLAVRNRLIS